MTLERFELSDAAHKYRSDIDLNNMGSSDGSRRRNGGCHVGVPTGFILLLLGILIAVGVGLIVHFAGSKDSVVCQCGTGREDTAIAFSAAADAIKDQCQGWASEGEPDICSKCPAHTTAVREPGQPATTASTEPTGPAQEINVRLPDTVVPVHYTVELMPMFFTENPEDFTYNGSVSVTIECKKPTDTVSIHAHHLVVEPSTIRFKGETPNRLDPLYLGMEIDTDRQFIVVRLSKSLVVGRRYLLSMSYSAKLDNGLKGLYYSQYSRDNKTVYMATTQFQPTDTRRAFPCFDEPALKATFDITLVRPEHLIALSNMPVKDNTTKIDVNGMTFVKDVFETTPVMSTYLLAFVVCDFKYLSNVTENNVLYRAWSTPDTVNQAAYSLKVGVKLLTDFERFFNISYPLPKQDMIAVPDFIAGAMENWGLIIYRQTAMLYEPGVSRAANKQRIAHVVSHELAHQWFGDLVSPSWWDDLWLNEGFATYVEYLGVDFMHPEWHIFDQFAFVVQRSFSFDGLISSHPLYVPVGHPDEINEIFDTISYRKGASIIRMMKHFLGDETFKQGLTNYLRGLAYGAARHGDLWKALEMQAVADGKGHIKVVEVMDTWTLQMNYPVVTITRDFQNRNQLYVTQERYLLDPNAEDPGKYESPYGYRWTIPITVVSSEEGNFNLTDADVHWITKDQDSATLTMADGYLPTAGGWILGNAQLYGYYRVNYQLGNWEALVNQLKADHMIIPAINRAQIIDDAWALSKAGFLPMRNALKTLEYMDNERNYVPWSAAASQISYVDKMLSLTPAYGAFKSFMNAKLTDPYTDLGIDKPITSHEQILARNLVARRACAYDIAGCKQEAARQYKLLVDNPTVNPIDVELKNIIYCYAIKSGGWDEWAFALEMYKQSPVASEKSLLLSALACSSQPWILNHYMTITMQENSPIRKQDALTVISEVSLSTIGKTLAWNFFRANYDVLLESFGRSFFSWTSLIGTITERFNLEFEYQELKQFRDIHADNLGTGARAFDQALEKTRTNIRWMESYYSVVTDWLGEQGFNVPAAA